MRAPISSGPWYQPTNGGISQMASWLNIATIAVTSFFQNASTQRSSSARCSRSSGSTTESSVSCAASSVARARCKMLLTAGTDVSSASATSAAFHRSTSRSTSTARWRAGRCCNAAINASRMLSRDVTTEAGSFGSLPSMASGTGSSHGTSPCSTSGSSAPRLGAPSPVGSGRLALPSSAVRHVLVAIR